MQIDWQFLAKQFPVAFLTLGVVWLAFREARKIVVGQRKDFKESLEKQTETAAKTSKDQQETFAKVIAEERQRMADFWEQRDIKLENIISQLQKETKEIGKQNRISNKILLYMSVNNPSLIKKSKSEKMNELVEVLKEPENDGI